MKYTTLPNTDIKVSTICLGTMTWGNQNTEAEGHKQLDYAIEQGINFIDTAEMYPVPASPESQGATSRIIGNWLQERKNRDQLILASKIVGKPSDYTAHIRTNGLQGNAIEEGLNAELKRLKTDYLDLYQIHWPERETNTFGVRDYQHNSADKWEDNFNEVLVKLQQQMKAGKIRQIGISNEKAWGTMRYLEESKQHELPRMQTIQNAYSLLCRSFEGDLAEIAMREHIGLLAYSPLAFGVLSGKYIKGIAEENSRLSLFPRFQRYNSDACTEATRQYLQLAEQNNMSLAEMSIAFICQQPFVTSCIIGATRMEQLQENIAAVNIHLEDSVIEQINEIHSKIPNPAT